MKLMNPAINGRPHGASASGPQGLTRVECRRCPRRAPEPVCRARWLKGSARAPRDLSPIAPPDARRLPGPPHPAAGGIAPEALADLSEECLAEWLRDTNLASRRRRVVEGYEVTASIDGNAVPDREVSLVKISRPGAYPQHVHKNSDAVFLIVSGTATLCSGRARIPVRPNDVVEVPRNLAHGFDLEEGKELVWVSIQSPPILDPETGDVDLHHVELTDLV
jgi:mannose-6-phosphate isomerase-like protein (cupin superfamily)